MMQEDRNSHESSRQAARQTDRQTRQTDARQPADDEKDLGLDCDVMGWDEDGDTEGKSPW